MVDRSRHGLAGARTSTTAVPSAEEAKARYFDHALGRRRHQVFSQGSCAGVNSYYFDEHGDVPFRADPTLETMRASRRLPLSAHRFERAG